MGEDLIWQLMTQNDFDTMALKTSTNPKEIVHRRGTEDYVGVEDITLADVFEAYHSLAIISPA